MNQNIRDFIKNLDVLFNPNRVFEVWYLGSPYSDKDTQLEIERVRLNRFVTEQLENRYEVSVFAPLVYSTAFDITVFKPSMGWYVFLIGFLLKFDRLIVLRIDGWQESFGLQLEIAIAKKHGILIEYLDLDEDGKILPLQKEGAGD